MFYTFGKAILTIFFAIALVELAMPMPYRVRRKKCCVWLLQ